MEDVTPRSRRAILAAALGAVGATLAGALGRPEGATAANGDELLVGRTNAATSQTTLNTSAATGLAVNAPSVGAIGVSGVAGGSTGRGIGVRGRSAGSNGIGVAGHSTANFTGVVGVSGGSSSYIDLAKFRTGVFGEAHQDSSARGVWGQTLAGRGVFGEATSGTGVRGEATTGTGVVAMAASNGTALRVLGKATFNRSGIISVPVGAQSAAKTNIAVTNATMVLALVQGSTPDTWVRAAFAHVGNATVTVYLNKPATSVTKVAFFLLG